jgi:2-(1,2-epoxy-1,2-dihydrophenyl)acetyl-CoA isomerase
MDKPVITALNGVAAGAGASIALGTDIVLAARSARLVFSFVRVGLSVDAGGGWHLVRALGPARARALLMSGADVGADEAERVGLVFRCFDDSALAGEALRLAQQLAKAPSTAIRSIKASIRAAHECRSLDEYLEIEADRQGAAGASPDYAEGVLAFLEKRKARFAE